MECTLGRMVPVSEKCCEGCKRGREGFFRQEEVWLRKASPRKDHLSRGPNAEKEARIS